MTEEEEDEECLKEEEDGLSGTGNTRLVTQPSCELSFSIVLSITRIFLKSKYICTMVY